MPIYVKENISYEDVYDDYQSVNPVDLIKGIPTKMALVLICHYTAQSHSLQEDHNKQIQFIREWYKRFPINVKQKIDTLINSYNSPKESSFYFINNISSAYLIELILSNHNDLPITHNLTPAQEENLFKAYLFFSSKWIKEQRSFFELSKGKPVRDWTLPILLPISELSEFKDFRLQFIKAVYFFKFCETNALFSGYLKTFLAARNVSNWHEYLKNLVSVYTNCLQDDGVKTVIDFTNEKSVFNSLLPFCVDVPSFQPSLDFLTLRETPLYKYSETELLFLNLNFFIDKIYQSILFDFADALIATGATYKGKLIRSKPDFIGIYSNEFVESGLFYKLMNYIFRQKDYTHFTGDALTSAVGDGTPDYLILDNKKIYVFELKNALFSGTVKYAYDNEQVQNELIKKLIKNEQGKPKGVTQLMNFISDVQMGRYDQACAKDFQGCIIYPIIVTTDIAFNLPLINSFINGEYRKQILDRGIDTKDYQIKDITIIDIDSIIKFQDFFIEKKITLNHVLADYPKYLQRGKNEIDKSLSFNKYIHDKTHMRKYDTPKMFFDEIKPLL